MSVPRDAALDIAKDLYRQTHEVDISNIDNIKRNGIWTKTLIKSYARNICTLSSVKTVYRDVQATTEMSETMFFDYSSALEKLFIIDDIEAWCPSIRLKMAIRSGKKKKLVDSSIAVAARELSPSYFNTDFKTLGFLFENLCFCKRRYSSLLS